MAIREYLAAILCGIAVGATSPAAFPQGFPEKLVRMISPFPSGISPDISARIVADGLTKIWKHQVIVEARPGANGFIALGAVKNAAPDGYVLLTASNSHLAINPSLFPKVPYDTEKDFAPVSLFWRAPFFLVVSTAGPFKTVPDLIAVAKANPGKVTYGTPYIGSPQHLGTALFEFLTGTRMTHVTFKEGTQVFVSVANGDIGWSMASLGSVMPIVKTGRAKLLAIAAKSRLASHPDVPTVGEAGGPAGFEVEAWNALLAPRATRQEVIRRIGADIARVVAQGEVQERFRSLGLGPASSTPHELAELIRADSKKYSELVKRTGAVAE